MFVTFEGMDGGGKTTALVGAAKALEASGKKVFCTKEPGGSPLGKKLRSMLLDASEPLCSEAELFLFLADRAEHVASVIRPALERGEIVFSDRYTDSTLAYQGGGRGLMGERLRTLNGVATAGLVPDLTFVFDLDPQEAVRRIALRAEDCGKRFDAQSLEFHAKIRQSFLAIAEQEPLRVRVIDAARPREEVLASVLAAIQEKLS